MKNFNLDVLAMPRGTSMPESDCLANSLLQCLQKSIFDCFCLHLQKTKDLFIISYAVAYEKCKFDNRFQLQGIFLFNCFLAGSDGGDLKKENKKRKEENCKH